MSNSNIPNELPTYIDPNLDLNKIRRECEALVKSRAKVSAGVAIVPIPFFDVAIDAGMLTALLPEITAKFGLIDSPEDVSKLDSEDKRFTELKDRAISFAGLMATRGVVKQTIQGFGGRILAKQVTKYIPLGGQMVAASIGYMIFKKIATDHIEECHKLAHQIQMQSRHTTQTTT